MKNIILITDTLKEKVKARLIDSKDDLAKEGELTMDGMAFDPYHDDEGYCERVVSVYEENAHNYYDSTDYYTLYTVTTQDNFQHDYYYYYFAVRYEFD